MHRPALALPAAVLAALLLAACSSGEPGDAGLPTYTPSTTSPSAGTTTSAPPSATTSATPEPDPSPWTALPTISEGPNKGVHNGIVLASSVAKTDDEKAAVEVYVEYWKLISRAGFETNVTKSEMDKVTTGTLQNELRTYVSDLKARGARTIGWASINVTEISSGPQGVLIQACFDNNTYDVSRKTGKRLEKTVPAYAADASVRAVDGRLVVTSSRTEDRAQPCRRD